MSDEELIERLRKVESSRETYDNNVTTNWYRNPDGPEAADRIAALKAEMAELRGMLEQARECLDRASHLLWEHCEGLAPRIEPIDEEIARINALLEKQDEDAIAKWNTRASADVVEALIQSQIVLEAINRTRSTCMSEVRKRIVANRTALGADQ